jgi:hypothetical protein
MLRALVALAVASIAVVQDTNAQSLARKTDAQDTRTFGSFLPPVSQSVPWLNLDTTTRLPRGNYPIGRNAEVAPFVLRMPHIEQADLAAFARGGG